MAILSFLIVHNIALKFTSEEVILDRLRRRVLAQFVLANVIPFLLVMKNPNLSTFCVQFYLRKLAPNRRPIRSNGRYIKIKVKIRKAHQQKKSTNHTYGTRILPKLDEIPLKSKARSTSLPNLLPNPSFSKRRNPSCISLQLSPPSPDLKNLSLEEGKSYMFFRLKKLGFQKSPTQPKTPLDGNCMVHAILDQMRYDPVHAPTAKIIDHRQLRLLIATSLPNLIDQGKIHWHKGIWDGSSEDWIKSMSQCGTYCDEVFLTAACLFLHRNIITYPVIVESECDRITNPIGKIKTSFEPFHLLLFSEAHFKNPHYQSIRPEEEYTQTNFDSSAVEKDLKFPSIIQVKPV